MSEMELDAVRREFMPGWFVDNFASLQELISGEDVNVSREVGRYVELMNIGCRAAALDIILQLCGGLKCFGEIEEQFNGYLKTMNKRKASFVKADRSAELLAFLIEKHETYILNATTTVLTRPKDDVVMFMEQLHHLNVTYENAASLTAPFNDLCELFVDRGRWVLMKNNFNSYRYNQRHRIQGASLTQDAIDLLKDAQGRLGTATLSETIMEVVKRSQVLEV